MWSPSPVLVPEGRRDYNIPVVFDTASFLGAPFMQPYFPRFCALAALLTAAAISTASAADAKPKPIKQIMKQMKAPVDKVKKGNATDADKKKLLELYTDLGKN